METHKETIVSDDGIFHCEQSNDFSCFICTSKVTCNDWRQHKATSCHISTLDRFNVIFTKTANKIVCKVCGVALRWEALKTHAHWHKIVPWYKPTDLYKTFFRNHIVEWESEFYCRACDKFFPEWSTTYIHISDNSHHNLLKNQPTVNDFAFWTTTAVPYDILVSEGFVSNIKSTTVKCTVCICWNISLKNVAEHVKGQQHLEKKVKFVQDLKVLKSIKSKQLLSSSAVEKSAKKLDAENSGNSENALKSCENIDCIYIVEQRRNKFSCEICDLELFSRKSVDVHIKEICHVNALKKYGCEQIFLKEQDYIYYCKCCDCLVLGIKNVHQHVRGIRHKNSLSELRSSSGRNEIHWNNSLSVKDKVATKPESVHNPGSHWSHLVPNGHVQTFNSGRSLCNLCNVIIPNTANVHDHIAGKTHVFSVKQLAENITFKEGNDYHCKCCDCNIPGIENVYGHINGYRHADSLRALEQHNPKANIKNSEQSETSKQSESVAKPNSHFLPDSHIQKLNSEELLCNLCDVIIPSVVNIQNHLAGKKHIFGVKQLAENIVFKEGNNYHCKCCDCNIPGLENVYGHLNGNRHAKSLSYTEHHKDKAGNENSVLITTGKSPETDYKLLSPPNYASLPNDHIEKRKNTESHHKRCDETISDEFNIQNYLTEPNHVFSKKQFSENISFKKNNTYHCKSCDCMIVGFDNLYFHIKGTSHAESLSALDQHKATANFINSDQIQTSKQPESAINTSSEKNDSMLPKNHIKNISFKENNNYHCKSCDCMIVGLDNLYFHIKGTSHAESLSALEQHKATANYINSDQVQTSKQPESAINTSSEKNDAMLPNQMKKISFKEKNNYHYKSCDCMIPGPDNIYVHNRHVKTLSDMEIYKEKASEKNPVKVETRKQPESAINNSSVKNDVMLSKDHIEKRNNSESHCKLCDETISGKFNLQKHLTGQNHVSSEKQLSENIFFKENNDYHCKCCDCMIHGLDNIYVHIKSNRHVKSLSDMEHNEKANEKNHVKVEAPKQPESAIKNSSVNNDSMMPKYHIERRNSKELQCRLCNEVILTDSNIQQHLTSKTHVLNAEKLSANISFVVDNNYQCRCCDCMIPGIENIYRHINGIRHAKTLSNFEKHENNASCKNVMEVKMPKQPQEIAKSGDKILFCDHIFKLNCKNFYCKICNCRIAANSSLGDHVAGKQHAVALKMYSDAITTVKYDKHYCKPCKLAIYGINNVYTHLQGIRHKTLAKKAYESEKRENASRFDYIAFQAELESNMKQCKQKFPIPEVPTPPEDIPCQFCSVSLPLTNDRHSHLAIHVGAELSPPQEPENLKETQEYVSAAEQKDQNSNLSKLTAKSENSEKTELPNHDTKVSSNIIQSDGTTILTNHTDSSNLGSTELVPSKPTENPDTNRRSPRTSSMQRIAQLLNPENDFIHDMRDKLRDTELGMKLCLIKEMKNIYCLICRKEVSESVQNYFKHLNSADHCEYLEGIEKDHILFELVPGQVSEFDLVCQYMEEVSECFVRCHVCDTDVENTDSTIKVHINDERHEQSRRKMHLSAKQNFEDIQSLLYCDWYTIHKYWCVPCSEYFKSELTFAKHLRSTGHAIVIRKSKNADKRIMHDFCSPCGLLWFGFRCTYANHCESTNHKWIIWKRDHESQELTKIVKIFLVELEQYVDYTIKHFDQLAVTELDKEETLIRDLEMAVKSKFSDAKAFLFGSKASGFRTGDSDIEIFLDCGDMYDRVKSSDYEILILMTTVHQCLCKHPQSWDVNKISTACPSSVLKTRHCATGLTCEISFKNGLAVENMKLIKYFNDIFPPSRKLILFLYQWLSLNGLAEPEGVSSKALYWYMIFYLQKESLLPSVGSLIAIKNNSHSIAGWKVGVSLDLSRNEPKSSSLSIRELLINFFTFYTKFDYRYDVVSPLLGQEVKRRTFADPQSLSKEMGPYVDYMNNLNDPRPFKIDSPMCVQDPLILQRNLTEYVSKAYLSRFRASCLKSIDVLQEIDESNTNR